MKPIYVAGMYSANNVLDLLDNVRIGERAGTKPFLMGYAPFVPWFDRGFHGHLREGENLTLQEYYDYSIAWLRRSDELRCAVGRNVCNVGQLYGDYLFLK